MNKKFISLFTITCFLACITACSQQEYVKNSSNLGGFVVKEIEPMNPPQIVNSEWLSTSEKDIFLSSDVIAEIKILNSQESVAKAEVDEGFTNTIYCKKYTAKIEKLYSSNSGYKDNDEISFFSSCHSSYDFEQNAIDIFEGQEYLVFLHKAIDDEKFKFSDIAPFSIKDPINNIIIKEKNKYKFSSIYTSFTSDEDELIEINQFEKRSLKTKQEKDFIIDFEKALKAYGKNNNK